MSMTFNEAQKAIRYRVSSDARYKAKLGQAISNGNTNQLKNLIRQVCGFLKELVKVLEWIEKWF